MATEHTINARPTKKLVAYVLTKDILLEDAILDLIDNSIDGAKRANSENYSGKEVTLEINKNHFKISDNCGGIPLKIAEEYAFRFGRPDDYAPLDVTPTNAVGNFGVGMKRALLKMGNNIKITSNTTDCYFEIDIDVEKWLKTDAWTFDFSKLEQKTNPSADLGTTILVTNLYGGVADKFSQTNFIDKLEASIKDKQVISIQKGLKIDLNNQTLASYKIELLSSKDIKPLYKKFEIKLDEGKVLVDLYAGIDKSDNNKAGWNVICNGRALLKSDKTPITGWGYNQDSLRVPNYHNQYGQFRGYVFFKSDEIKTLPWNTTKSSVDQEHPAYRKTFQEMISAMKEVFTFLNSLDKESESESQPLNELLEKTKSVALENVSESTAFVYPETKSSSQNTDKLTWIKYQRSASDVALAMRVMGAKKPNEVGERTFDIYFDLNVKSEA